jgi:hypothetical protein
MKAFQCAPAHGTPWRVQALGLHGTSGTTTVSAAYGLHF